MAFKNKDFPGVHYYVGRSKGNFLFARQGTKELESFYSLSEVIRYPKEDKILF